MKHSIGIDISKAHLDAFRLTDGTHARFANDPQGFSALQDWIGDAAPDLVVYEATGAYHGCFEQALAGVLPLVKVNPLQARRFAQARGTRAKTDAVDAAMLAQMGSALDLAPDRPVRKDHHDLKELQVGRTALVKEKTRLSNRLKTQRVAFTRRQTEARLTLVERQLAAINVGVQRLLHKARARQLDILKSIPGFGSVTAAAILIECPEIGTLGRKKIASLAGLAPP